MPWAQRIFADGQCATPVPVALALFIAERLDFWRKLSTWPHEGKGWAGRTVVDIRYAVVDWQAEGKPI